MNQDQRRALKQLKLMYPKALHSTLESEFRIFAQGKEASTYKTPIDLVEAYFKWLAKSEVREI